MNDADLWEMLTKNGIAPDSATGIVQSHKGMSDADLWERLVKNGAPENAATQIVSARSGSSSSSSSGDDTGLTLGNMARSFGMGATLGLGKSSALPERMRLDATKEDAFKKNHKVADFFLKLGGGAVAPILATMAAPEVLGGALGAAGLGAATGGVAALGEDSDKNIAASERVKNGLAGAAVGGAAGAAGYGVSKAIGGAVGTVLDRVNPKRVVARAARELVTPADVARLTDINAQAPGTASAATATLPPSPKGQPVNSRFLSMVRGVSKSPKAGAAAEAHLLDQTARIKATTDVLGDQMDALGGEMPLSSNVRSALTKVRAVLGGKAPDAPPSNFDANPLALEKSTPFEFDPAKETLSIADARSALSRLRYLSRNAAKRGTEANGPTTYEINAARDALQKQLYKHAPTFESLDQQYATMMNQQRQVDKLLKTVRLARQNGAANEALQMQPTSVGGSLHGPMGITRMIADKLLTNKAGAADAVAQFITKPGDPKLLQTLLKYGKPVSPRFQAGANGLTAGAIPALRGLLFPESDDEMK